MGKALKNRNAMVHKHRVWNNWFECTKYFTTKTWFSVRDLLTSSTCPVDSMIFCVISLLHVHASWIEWSHALVLHCGRRQMGLMVLWMIFLFQLHASWNCFFLVAGAWQVEVTIFRPSLNVRHVRSGCNDFLIYFSNAFTYQLDAMISWAYSLFRYTTIRFHDSLKYPSAHARWT